MWELQPAAPSWQEEKEVNLRSVCGAQAVWSRDITSPEQGEHTLKAWPTQHCFLCGREKLEVRALLGNNALRVHKYLEVESSSFPE